MIVELALVTVLILPALWLAARRSPALVGYAVVLYALNREVRRVVDWWQGSFNPFSLISLLPLMVVGLLLGPFLVRLNRLHVMAKRAFLLLLFGILYGAFVGLARNGLAALYSTAEYLSPVALMGYAATADASDKTADRWMKIAGCAAVAASLYGWYQYLTIPAWDAFWVESVGFIGYCGKLAPMEMSVFATFAERGPCAVFLALSAIPMLVSRRWRLVLGWPEGLLIVSVILLTLVRTGVILVALAVLLYPLLNGGRGSMRLLLILGAFGLITTFGFDWLPGAARLNDRFSTLQNMQDDFSCQARMGIAEAGAEIVFSSPIGFGIGSAGLGGRLNTGSVFDTGAVVADNGYLEVLASLGLPGTFCFGLGLIVLWRYLALCTRFGLRDDYIALGRGFFAVFLVGMMATNFFNGLTVMWISLGQALSPALLDKLELEPEPGEPEPLTDTRPELAALAALAGRT